MKVDYSVFENNIKALSKKNASLANSITGTQPTVYTSTMTTKNNSIIPVLNNGRVLNSKYNPEREAGTVFDGTEEFVLFAGLTNGSHIRFFLEQYPDRNCAVTESSIEAFNSLLQLIDFTDIFNNPRIKIIAPITSEQIVTDITYTYLPAIDGNFCIRTLRAWAEYFNTEMDLLKTKVQKAIELIKADFSVQANFGKIWTRNIMLNLKLAEKLEITFPKCDNTKTAYILGAGPSLTQQIPDIKHNRAKYVLFASDTAYSVLMQHSIEPDFYISIDPQNISHLHITKGLSKNTIGVFDLCSNYLLPKYFFQNKNQIIFTTGRHPLATYAQTIHHFPYLDTSSGTVAISALDLAYRLGFKSFEFTGLDFAYTNGIAYAKGTYLSQFFNANSTKINPTETEFSKIVFRTPVAQVQTKEGLTYTSDVLNFYKNNFQNYKFDNNIWKNFKLKKFDYNEFIKKLKQDAKQKNDNLKTILLPNLAFYSKKNIKNIDFDLVIKDILKYNSEYE